MSQPTGDQAAEVYAASADRIADFARSLNDAQLATPVPGTPKWSVIEVLSHLVGRPADVCAGNLEGVATDPWTQAQVEVRRDRSVCELLDEWLPRFELFRVLMGPGRHSAVAAMEWSGDPSPYLYPLCPFGPLRDTDVIE